MAKNRLGVKDIESRLGSRLGDAAGFRREQAILDAEAQEASSGRGTALFSLGAVMFAAVAGAYIATGGNLGEAMSEMFAPPEVVKPQLANSCDPGWQDDRVNSEQIHCYMTRNIERLCNPDEKQALVKKLRDFQRAADSADTRFTMSAAQVAVNPQSMALGMQAAKAEAPNLSSEERAAERSKGMEMGTKMMAPAFEAGEKIRYNVSKEALVADVKDLVQRNYIKAEDFGSNAPKIVTDGLAAAGESLASTCP